MIYFRETSIASQSLFSSSDPVNVILKSVTGKIDIRPITVPIKKIKVAARQHYGYRDEMAWCEHAFRHYKGSK